MYQSDRDDSTRTAYRWLASLAMAAALFTVMHNIDGWRAPDRLPAGHKVQQEIGMADLLGSKNLSDYLTERMADLHEVQPLHPMEVAEHLQLDPDPEAFKRVQADTVTTHGRIKLDTVCRVNLHIEYQTDDGNTWRVFMYRCPDGTYRFLTPEPAGR